MTCVLRVLAPHIPGRKTSNEVAMMAFVREHTTIPVPAVIAYDYTPDNILGSEYTILEYCHGEVLSGYINETPHSEKTIIVDQMIDFLQQLSNIEFMHTGGLKAQYFGAEGVAGGPYIDVHFWTALDDVPGDPSTYNPYGPHVSFAAFCADYITKLWKLIQLAPGLEQMRDMPVPELLSLLASPGMQATLEQGLRVVLAHKDLHFGSILYDHEARKITAVIDWELAAIVPHPLWNPGNFLWNAKPDESSQEEKAAMLRLFDERVRERGLGHVLSSMPAWPNEEQSQLWRAVTLMKRIANGGIRGWQRENMKANRAEFEQCIRHLVALNQ